MLHCCGCCRLINSRNKKYVAASPLGSPMVREGVRDLAFATYTMEFPCRRIAKQNRKNHLKKFHLSMPLILKGSESSSVDEFRGHPSRASQIPHVLYNCIAGRYSSSKTAYSTQWKDQEQCDRKERPCQASGDQLWCRMQSTKEYQCIQTFDRTRCAQYPVLRLRPNEAIDHPDYSLSKFS